jgi:predicted ArsR family transcriptional regulator
MPLWKKRFLESTRGRVVLLLQKATQTVDELAESLNLTDNAVRSHLSSLERDGLVEQSGVRRGTRKPFNAYRLTPEAEQLLSRAYQPFLSLLLGVMEDRVTDEERVDLLREVGRRAAVSHRTTLEGKDREARIRGAIEAMRELGGMAEVEQIEGKCMIKGHGCPLSSVVKEHPEVCRSIETLLSEIIGAPVKECCNRGDALGCRFEILPPPPR